MENPCVHIYHGDGKGKTTAAAGLCLRAIGAGATAVWLSFLKDGTSSELKVFKQIDRCVVYPCPAHVSFTFCMSDDERQALRHFYKEWLNKAIFALPMTDILVLDEVLDAVDTGLVDEKDLLILLKTASSTELVLTGRHATPAVMETADYITAMKAVRHPYNCGIQARCGIEY